MKRESLWLRRKRADLLGGRRDSGEGVLNDMEGLWQVQEDVGRLVYRTEGIHLHYTISGGGTLRFECLPHRFYHQRTVQWSVTSL